VIWKWQARATVVAVGLQPADEVPPLTAMRPMNAGS
jgi:hypothetical protein